jgi:HK97 family phage portal protein
MSFLATVKNFLALDTQMPPPMHQRDITLATSFDYYPDLAQQLINIRNSRNGGAGPWRAASVREAMGVPAIFGAVNLLANLTGSMSMRAFRNGVELAPEDRPRLIVKPDPFEIPREFYRATAYNLASRGEAWWWVGSRDSDGNALSLINVDPALVTLEEDPADPRYPIITIGKFSTRDRTLKRDDIRQLVYSREPGTRRGWGPLQACGAAISVAVESQVWAANFFAGGNSAIWVKTSIPLSGGIDDPDDEDSRAEVQRFLDAWMDKDANTPRITDDTVEDIKELNLNPQGAQMLEARAHQNVEIATMYNIDAEILNAVVAGSSLTYQNVGQRFDNLIKQALRPHILEPIEQTISEFLTRSTVAVFDTDFLTSADPATRWAVYQAAVPVLGQEEAADLARRGEGLIAGDVEKAPIPFAPPQAIPTVASLQVRSTEHRCQAIVPRYRSGVTRMTTCNKAYPVEWDYCPRCKSPRAAA